MFMKISKLAEICKSNNPMRDEMQVLGSFVLFLLIGIFT